MHISVILFNMLSVQNDYGSASVFVAAVKCISSVKLWKIILDRSALSNSSRGIFLKQLIIHLSIPEITAVLELLLAVIISSSKMYIISKTMENYFRPFSVE